MVDLPVFRYHPDPITTGFVVASQTACLVCRKKRGYVYAGPAFCVEDIDEEICPWCIADGRAAQKFDATFTDDDNVPDGVPGAVVDEVLRRTPGFSGWQQESWLYHCDDAAAFRGLAGFAELQAYPTLLAELAEEFSVDYVEDLEAEGSPTAYLFRCLHCGKDLVYSDCD